MAMIRHSVSALALDTRSSPSKKDASPKMFPLSFTVRVRCAPLSEVIKMVTRPLTR